MLKGKLLTTTESLTHSEADAKANRETITRIVADLNKLEKDAMNAKIGSDNLKAVNIILLFKFFFEIITLTIYNFKGTRCSLKYTEIARKRNRYAQRTYHEYTNSLASQQS